MQLVPSGCHCLGLYLTVLLVQIHYEICRLCSCSLARSFGCPWGEQGDQAFSQPQAECPLTVSELAPCSLWVFLPAGALCLVPDEIAHQRCRSSLHLAMTHAGATQPASRRYQTHPVSCGRASPHLAAAERNKAPVEAGGGESRCRREWVPCKSRLHERAAGAEDGAAPWVWEAHRSSGLGGSCYIPSTRISPCTAG